jgi:hypothetical protein
MRLRWSTVQHLTSIIAGGSICAAFLVFGIASVLLYKPVRRYCDNRFGLEQATDDMLEMT